jgi:peptidoglycan/LPS O-acetylase OafA/YrhL
MAGGSLLARARTRNDWVDFRLGYQPAFDGLRGLGVTTFVIYHAIISFEATNSSWFFPGAYLWLELFFVQSGFLITSLLLDEWHRTGEVRLRNFYARRALRLFPALAAVALVSAFALLTFSEHKGESQAWIELGASLAYVQNWLAAFGVYDFPYYLSHAWSLSIEEQFYLVAPIGIIVLVVWQRSLRRAIPFLLLGAVVSAVGMGYLASRTFHPLHLQRLYYGTDTRAQGLLIGVALAFAIHSGLWLRTERHARIARVWGLIGTAVMVVLLFTADIRSKPMYYGLFLLCSTSVAGILSELLRHPEGRLARGLSSKPLQGAGEMTYGIYLWHWPVLMIVAQYTSWPEFPTIATQVVITFLVAAVSFRWLERPILVRYGPRFPRTTPERERAHRERMAAMPPVSEPAPVEVGATSDLEPDAAPAASQSAVL